MLTPVALVLTLPLLSSRMTGFPSSGGKHMLGAAPAPCPGGWRGQRWTSPWEGVGLRGAWASAHLFPFHHRRLCPLEPLAVVEKAGFGDNHSPR